jgi:cysteine desulfurase/selenocysteine lyase
MRADKLTNGSVNYHTWEENAERTRAKCARFINAEPEEIAFVMNASQGISFALNGIDFQEGENVIVHREDFPSIYLPWLSLKERGVEIRCVETDDGRIPYENIAKLFDDRTRAVAISSVQFKTGFLCDLESLGNLCRENGAYFIVDAIQSLGFIKMDVKQYNIDLLSTSCYKWLLSPDGIGFFFCRKEILDEINTSNIGWMSTVDPWSFPTELELHPSAKKFEAGTLPWPQIYSFDTILDFIDDVTVDRIKKHVFGLHDYLIEELKRLGIRIVSSLKKNERSGIIVFDAKDNKRLAEVFQANKVRISLRDGIRVAPHIYNNKDDIERLLGILKSFLKDA